MKIQLRYFCLIVLILSSINSFSQDTLDLISNPSFEGEPERGQNYYGIHIDEFINSWFDCGLYNFPEESQPDIHSEETDIWSVKHFPSDGKTFLSLVVRDNGTWESVTQRLKDTLEKDNCYQFTIDLSKTHKYLSSSRITRKPQDYIVPAILRIWLGRNYCDMSQLIYTSPPIGRNQWEAYEVDFQADANFNYFTIQAIHIDEEYPQSGNILLDNISPIIKISCNE